MTLVLVMAGGAIGALGRYLAEITFGARNGYLIGTLVANVLGTFLIVLIASATLSLHWSPAVSTGMSAGFCGALSTFSTFSFQSLMMLRERRYAQAISYIALTVFVCLMASVAGIVIGHFLVSPHGH